MGHPHKVIGGYYFQMSKAIQYIPSNMHTVLALLCFVVVIHWMIFPYPSGLLHWHFNKVTSYLPFVLPVISKAIPEGSFTTSNRTTGGMLISYCKLQKVRDIRLFPSSAVKSVKGDCQWPLNRGKIPIGHVSPQCIVTQCSHILYLLHRDI